MVAGSGLGGVIFPIMASHLVPQVGFGWTIRIIAFTIFAMMLVACVTVKSRLPPRPRSLTLQILLEPFKNTQFNLITLAAFLFFFGLFIPINFIEVQALESGMSARLAGYLIPVLNALR
jgi:Na+/melibiose symporter-like transporter